MAFPIRGNSAQPSPANGSQDVGSTWIKKIPSKRSISIAVVVIGAVGVVLSAIGLAHPSFLNLSKQQATILANVGLGLLGQIPFSLYLNSRRNSASTSENSTQKKGTRRSTRGIRSK